MPKRKYATIHVVCGCMFSGKTEELVRLARRALIAKLTVQVFKPKIDFRGGIHQITSHHGNSIEAIPLEDIDDIFAHLNSPHLVFLDEAQFFGDSIVQHVLELSKRRIGVIVGGLDTNFRGEPFGSIPDLLAIAHTARKLHAICVVCGGKATRTQRLVDGLPAQYDQPLVKIGAEDAYQARCMACHERPWE